MQIQVSAKRILKLVGYGSIVAYLVVSIYALYLILWSVNAGRLESFQNHIELFKQQQQLCQKDSYI